MYKFHNAYIDWLLRKEVRDKEEDNMGKLSEEAYNMLEHRTSSKTMIYAQEPDYNNLIDLALDMKDFKWARQLNRKKQVYLKLEERRRQQE